MEPDSIFRTSTPNNLRNSQNYAINKTFVDQCIRKCTDIMKNEFADLINFKFLLLPAQLEVHFVANLPCSLQKKNIPAKDDSIKPCVY